MKLICSQLFMRWMVVVSNVCVVVLTLFFEIKPECRQLLLVKGCWIQRVKLFQNLFSFFVNCHGNVGYFIKLQ